jgi:hypothetical protein
VVKLRPTTENAYSAALRHLRAAFRRGRLADIAPPRSLATSHSAMRRAGRVKGEMTVLSRGFTYAGRHLGLPGRTP